MSLSFLAACCGLPLLLLSTPATSQRSFHVSPAGDDSNEGSAGHPFRSLWRARDAVRLQLAQHPGAVTVVVHGGRYVLDSMLRFDARDGGRPGAPVRWIAAAGEKPVLSGAVPLQGWRPLEQGEGMLRPAAARIWVLDLRARGILSYGDPTAKGQRPELFCAGQPQPLARWPDSGFATGGQARGQTPTPPAWNHTRGTREGIFEYLDPRIARWADEQDPRLGGYWFWDWSEEYQRLERVDTAAGLLYVAPPYHRYGYRDSLRFFGLNLLCELDRPGEWYLDRAGGLLYWYPPQGGPPPAASLSVLDAPYMISIQGASRLELRGLTLEESRGSGILIRGGRGVVLRDCNIQEMGTNGIVVEGGRDHLLDGLHLQVLGYAGMLVSGGERAGLVPAGHEIRNCVVERFSLFKRTYEPAVRLEGCGMVVRNNHFRYSSSSAMRLEGNDFLVAYNEIDHVVSESDDQGAIDVYYNPSYRGNVIAYNYFHDVQGGTTTGAAAVRLDDMISGFLIRGNVFERCGSQHFGGVQIHGGKDNIVENNLFLDCPFAVSFSPWGERWDRELQSPQLRRKLYEEVDIRSALYQRRYPALAHLAGHPDSNVVRRNLAIGEGTFYRGRGPEEAAGNRMLPAAGESRPDPGAAFLRAQGLTPIPFRRIGPGHNPSGLPPDPATDFWRKGYATAK